MMLPAVISARFLERYERSVKSGCIELLTYAGRETVIRLQKADGVACTLNVQQSICASSELR